MASAFDTLPAAAFTGLNTAIMFFLLRLFMDEG